MQWDFWETVTERLLARGGVSSAYPGYNVRMLDEQRNTTDPVPTSAAWPALPLKDWQDTYATLHRWAQIVGKVRLARMPWINH